MDYQSTTPTDRRVLEAMLPFFVEEFGNPHSVEHVFGIRAQAAVEVAIERIGKVVGASGSDLVVTSGATEANNMVFRGLLRGRKKLHFVSCQTEHRSVLGTLAAMEVLGHHVTILPVDSEGLLDLEDLVQAIGPNTALVSVMAVNNEIGVIQPYGDIGALCRSHDILFHVDAAQGFGRVPLDVNLNHIDLMSISAHKIYGPKGVGALFLGPRARPRMQPLITGGGQQNGWRAGTLPSPLVVGFGVAADLMLAEGARDLELIRSLREGMERGLRDCIAGVHLNGSADARYPGNLNLRFDGVDSESLLLLLPDVAMSTGSACSAGAVEPSAVLRALGLSVEQAAQSVRLGFGRMTTMKDVERVVARLAWAVGELRR